MVNVQAGTKGFVSVPPLNRFWSKVDIKGEDDCWPWLGATDGRYGQFWLNGKLVRAHRYAWELKNGKQFPAELEGCHSCNNPICVNPNHVWPGTHKENIVDAYSKGLIPPYAERKKPKEVTHCRRGHEFTVATTGRHKNGTKFCKVCKAEADRLYGKNRRAAMKADHAP